MEWFSSVKEVIKNNGVILTPTDTVWGLSASALDTTAMERIYLMKQRPKNKSFIVLMASIEQLKEYVSDDLSMVLPFMKSKRPTTIIYQQVNGLPKELLASDGSLAIRIPKETWLKDLLEFIKIPIISTSANLSGEPTPINFKDVSKHLTVQVDFVVPYQPISTGHSSQIIKVENGQVNWIRK